MEFVGNRILFYDTDIENESFRVIVKVNVIQNKKINIENIDFSKLSAFLSRMFYL